MSEVKELKKKLYRLKRFKLQLPKLIDNSFVNGDNFFTKKDLDAVKEQIKEVKEHIEKLKKTQAEQSVSIEKKSESKISSKNRITEREKYWSQGFIAACAITLKNHGCDTIVEDTLKCNFMDESMMRRRGVDEYDIKILKPIIKEIKRKQNINNTKS